MQPMILLVLVGPLLNHVANDAEGVRRMLAERFGTTDYLTFLFSGIAVFTILVNSVMAGIPIAFDRETGFIDRILAAPVSRSAIIASRFVYVILFSLMQVGIVGVVAVALGVRPHAPLQAVLAVAGYGALLCAGISVLSIALAFVLPHHSIFFAITGFMLSPLLVLSPTFIGRGSMPPMLAAIARWNPMTHAIEPIRDAFLGTSNGNWLVSAGALLAFDAVCFALAVRVFRKNLD
jgi:ABC-2 type transport system permease protein